jgi:hypothetical protein
MSWSDGGKGDGRRPANISEEQLKQRWEAIFGKKDKPEDKKDEKEETQS